MVHGTDNVIFLRVNNYPALDSDNGGRVPEVLRRARREAGPILLPVGRGGKLGLRDRRYGHEEPPRSAVQPRGYTPAHVRRPAASTAVPGLAARYLLQQRGQADRHGLQQPPRADNRVQHGGDAHTQVREGVEGQEAGRGDRRRAERGQHPHVSAAPGRHSGRRRQHPRRRLPAQFDQGIQLGRLVDLLVQARSGGNGPSAGDRPSLGR